MKNKQLETKFKKPTSMPFVAVVAIFMLSFFNVIWADDIALNKKDSTIAAVKRVIPKSSKIEGPFKDGEISYYVGFDNKQNVLGYALLVSEKSYHGYVPVVIGYQKNLSKMTTIAILENQESKGIGSKIAEEPFVSSFNGGSALRKYRLVKTGKTDVHTGDINSITGATSSSSVVILCVNKANDYVAKNRGKIQK